MKDNIVPFEMLEVADLQVDTVYKGGSAPNIGSEVLHKLMPGCGLMSGFRKVNKRSGGRFPAYVVLYTSMEEIEWPDFLDCETGVFRYYGDNRTAGRQLLDTDKKGNQLLEDVFTLLNKGGDALKEIPPFFVFKKTGTGRDVQFLGLAAPGNPNISPDRDLVAFWRSLDDKRFQNYESYFTILDTREPIDRRWLYALINEPEQSIQYAPEAWKRFVRYGRNGIKPLIASKMPTIPTRYEQLQTDVEGNLCLTAIRDHYAQNPYGFEMCAKDIVEKMDGHFKDFSLTRPWRDGGRDALGYYVLEGDGHRNIPLRIDCALEAKCYAVNHSVGVKEMSRLISRIRYRQFGIMVTTSYVHEQAYKEVAYDQHPILIVSATDIAATLRYNAINSSNIDEWLFKLDHDDNRGAGMMLRMKKNG